MVKFYAKIHHSVFNRKWLKISLHIIVWVVFFILPIYLVKTSSTIDTHSLYRTYIQLLIYAIIFYSNYLWLTPKLFFGNRKILYFLASFAIIAVMTSLNEYSFQYFEKRPREVRFENPPLLNSPPGEIGPQGPPPARLDNKRPPKNWPVYNFIITTLFISGFGMGLCFSDKLVKNEKERKEAEKEKLNTELAFLKNQINPHFFFNTLNNIYSLVQTNVKDGQAAILQLSKLMRYLLYETERGDKMLSQEIDFMKTYIELMKLRISEKVDLSVHFPEEYHDFTLPPLLFLPFIENAFKHGISYRRESFIIISLDLVPGALIFECKNSIGAKPDELLKADYGIGLENIRKRLSLLYPRQHELTFTETSSSFTAFLKINLKETGL